MRLAALVLVLAACNPPSDAVPDATETAPIGELYAFGGQQKLLPNVAAPAVFGHAIGLGGDRLISGAMIDSQQTAQGGAAYVFARSGSTWSREQTLFPSDPTANIRFGKSADISGHTVIVGATGSGAGQPLQGAAYVYTRSGTTWTQQQKIVAADGAPADRFGQTVRIEGETAVIGAPQDDDLGADSGSVYVFVRNNGTTWAQQQKLTAPDGAAGQRFGYFVAISGTTIVVGARFDDDLGANSGSAYVFTRSGTTWSFQQKLLASDGTAGDQFGRAVSVSNDTALIGAMGDASLRGAAYVFVRDAAGVWTQQQKLTASDGTNADEFGSALVVLGNTAVIGARKDDNNFSDTGSTYIYKRVGTTWTEDQKLKPSDGQRDDRFGQALDFNGTTIVAGAYLDDDIAADSGAAYSFEQPAANPVVNGSFETGDYAGWTLIESANPTGGTFGLATETQTVPPGANLFDFTDSLLVFQNSPSLPHTFDATDGTHVAFNLQNAAENHRMFQTVTIPAGCGAVLRWDMEYLNSGTTFVDGSQTTAVHIRDPNTDQILATPFKTVEGTNPANLFTMTPFEANVSAFDGQTVRLDFEHTVFNFHFLVAWDNIRIECSVPTPKLEVAPSLHNFGDHRVGTTSPIQIFTITNTGSANLTVQSITTAAPFAVTNPTLPATITPGNNITFTGQFSPTVTGVANGTISIASNDAASPKTISVSGTGTAPAIDVSPTSHDFGNQRVGTTSAGKQFTITNTGTATLNVSAIATTGPFATPNTSFAIPPSGSQNISVTFSPVAVGAAAGTLRITHDAAGSPSIFNLAGTGIRPAIAVAPSPLAFGTQRVGTTSAGQNLRISNVGTDTLNVATITTTGVFATANTPLTIAVGAFVDISVTFSPTVAGAASGSVVITHDAPGSPTTILASGTGIEPQISVSPGSLSFGDQLVNTTSNAQTFDIDNPGTADLTITNITTAAPFSTTNTFPIIVAPGNSATISVTFSPSATGAANDSVTITSDAGSPTVSVSGTGVAPGIVVAATLPFGDVRTNTSANLSLPVTNNGTSDLTITAANTTAPYSVTTTFPIVIAPSTSANLDLVFAPTATGLASDNLTILSDVATSPTIVALSGTGVEPVATPDISSIDFGLQRVGVTSPQRTINFQNTGTFPLTVTSVAATAPFAVGSGAGFVLQPTESVQITVTFTPSVEGGAAQNLTIAHDAAGAPTTISLAGIGTIAELDASPGALDFGDIRVGTISPPKLVTVKNLGLAPLNIQSITPPAGFTLQGQTLPTNVLPNASLVFELRFSPTSPGPANANVAIATTVGPANVMVTGNAVPSALTPDRTAIDLGTVRLGEASAAQTIQLTNTTAAPISIGNAVVSDPQFVLDPAPSQAPIAPGATATFAVRYVPLTAGGASSQIDITLVGESVTELTIAVSGQGLGEEAGCCSTGGGSGSTSALLGLAVLCVLRRRRRML